MEWIESLLDKYGKLKLAQDAKDLEDSRKVLAIDRDVVRAHHRRNLGEAFHNGEDADGMIHIGDRLEHHHHADAPAAGRAPASRLLRLATAAALLFTGAGSGAAATLLLENLFTPAPAPPPASAPAADRDTLFELRLGPPANPGHHGLND